MYTYPFIEEGSSPAEARFRIDVTPDGPYLLFGRPPLLQYFIMPDPEGESWYFQAGRSFPTEAEPTALCRCGTSKNKPYCDGAHHTARWNPRLTDEGRPLLDGAELYEGPAVSMTDNESYCVFARFCDAKGRAWNLVEESDNAQARRMVIREASLCPGSRLMAWDNASGHPFEPHYAPGTGLIEDPALGLSGGLWIRGGIPVRRPDGAVDEVRNRVVLCRCGQSSNKPYCDGTHASMRFRDELEGQATGETVPEKVY